MNFQHHPVLNKEVIGVFEGTEKKCFVDCTVGMGGHSYHILSNFKNAEVVAIDMDLESIDKAKENLEQFGARVSFHHMNFVNLFERILKFIIFGIGKRMPAPFSHCYKRNAFFIYGRKRLQARKIGRESKLPVSY